MHAVLEVSKEAPEMRATRHCSFELPPTEEACGLPAANHASVVTLIMAWVGGREGGVSANDMLHNKLRVLGGSPPTSRRHRH